MHNQYIPEKLKMTGVNMEKFVDNVSKVINMIDDVVHHKTLDTPIDQIKKVIIKKYGISASFFGEINNMTNDIPKVILNLSKKSDPLTFNHLTHKEYLVNMMNIPENVANYMIYGLMDIDDVYSYVMKIDLGIGHKKTSVENGSTYYDQIQHRTLSYLIQNNSIELMDVNALYNMSDGYGRGRNYNGNNDVPIEYRQYNVGDTIKSVFKIGEAIHMTGPLNIKCDKVNAPEYEYEYHLIDSQIDVMNKKIRIYVTKYEREQVSYKDNSNNITNYWKYNKTNHVEFLDIPLVDNSIFKCDFGMITIKKIIYDAIELVGTKQYKPTNPTKNKYKILKLNDVGEIIEEITVQNYSRTLKDFVLEHSIEHVS